MKKIGFLALFLIAALISLLGCNYFSKNSVSQIDNRPNVSLYINPPLLFGYYDFSKGKDITLIHSIDNTNEDNDVNISLTGRVKIGEYEYDLILPGTFLLLRKAVEDKNNPSSLEWNVSIEASAGTKETSLTYKAIKFIGTGDLASAIVSTEGFVNSVLLSSGGVYAIKTRENNYAKFKISDISVNKKMTTTSTDPIATIKFDYLYQPNGTTSFEGL